MPKAFAWRSSTSMPNGNFNIFLGVSGNEAYHGIPPLNGYSYTEHYDKPLVFWVLFSDPFLGMVELENVPELSDVFFGGDM